ncbi:hypothetical protein B0T17DRAFT_613979 [Bombardia bombarda]|uniref:Uncharacterized protein n=1 Tax=Bombardia bombarda TaxID=252184 RepID=A0AA39XQQ8_9PEZI|nr:hypothetical protein B0T17DRAFT_613979 [Bombardia bombarda]
MRYQEGDIVVPFSLDSPYLTGGEYDDVPDLPIDPSYLRYLGCDEKYLTAGASAMDMGLVRKELAAVFHDTTARMIRYDRDAFTDKWSSALPGMDTVGETIATVSRCQLQKLEKYFKLEDYFNKHFAIYFTPYTEDKRAAADDDGRAIGRYIYRHWLWMHRTSLHCKWPPFHRHHFMARATKFVDRRIGPDCWNLEQCLVTDLPYVLAFHRSVCDSAAACEDDIKPQRQWTRADKRNPDPKLRNPNFAPRLSQQPLSYRQHGFQLGHIFRSLFMVVDGCHSHTPKEDYRLKPAKPEFKNFEHDEWEADWRVSGFKVVLVRTGDDHHLSAPVSFQPLFDSGRTLPLERDDDCRGENAVRVRLDHALEFVEYLVRREEEALPHLREAAEALEHELDQVCEQWVERVLHHAAEVGLDNIGYTWQAIRRARARLNGEAFDLEQMAPEWELLRHWYPGGT